MYKFYIVPDATTCDSHSDIYTQMKLFYDPYAESDAYAVIGPKSKDELNKSGSLEFTVLPANIHYNDFYKRKTMVIVFDEGTWLYEGVVTDAPIDFYKQRKVTCASPLSFLCDSVQAPDEKNVISVPTSSGGTTYSAVPDTWLAGADPKSLHWRVQHKKDDGSIEYVETNDTTPVSGTRYFYPIASDGNNYSGSTTTKSAGTNESIIAHITRLLDVHNSQVDPFKRIFPGKMYNSSDTTTHEFKSSGYRTTWDALKSDILDDYGKYFTITRGNDNNLYLNYLELAQLPSSSVPLIEYANNMLELNESDDADDDIFTVLVPIGKDNLTVKDVTGHDTPEDSTKEVSPYIRSWGGNKRYVVVSPKAVKRYGYIIKPQSFSDVSDKDALYTRAVNYIKNNYDYHQEYEVKAIDLRFINGTGHRILVGDKCRIHSKWHEVDTNELYVISAEHDLANPENDSYRIGIPTSDREANNRTLTGQSQNAKSKSAANEASTSSGMSRMNSILEDYIHVTEWGLEMNSRLKNEYESSDKKYMTRFQQDEYSINLAAQKLFGIDGEGYGDIDAGYVAVLSEEYKDNKGAWKNPVNEHWFEKIGSQYKLSEDTVANPNKQYYVQRLWTRYSNLEVGEGGIKARVDGNYERSTYCSSWIESNEDSIIALTGHLYVDDEGHAHITSGSGLRTDHQEDKTTPTYIQVQRSMYSQNPNPMSKHWYERKLNSSGAWEGNGKSDQSTNDDYYISSSDTEVNRNKYYYYKSNIREEFAAEYGVYDEDNLVGGVVSRMINNPSYHKVDRMEVRELQASHGSPQAQGWYEYNESTGTFGITLDTTVQSLTKYYYVVNNETTYTDIWGEHIVIGRTVNYDGMDPATEEKVRKYLSDNNRIDGTITEIASDVVVVNTLLAKYIEADDITANTSLWAATGMFNDVYVSTLHVVPDDWSDVNPGEGTVINNGTITTDNISCWSISIYSDTAGDVAFGESVPEDSSAERAEDPANIVMEFDDPTYSGDDVTIRYRTAGMDDFDDDVAITFTKPASLGSVTWSSGNTLTVKTVGGKDFIIGSFSNYVPSGSSEAAAMNSAKYLDAETKGYNTVYGFYYDVKDAITGNTSTRKVMTFKTPKNRYTDATGTVRTRSSTGKGDNEEISLGVGGVSTIYAQYKTEKNLDDDEDEYVSLKGIKSYAPEIRIRATIGSTNYGANDTVPLGYDGSVVVKTQAKAHDAEDYSDYRKLTVTAPAKPTISSPASASAPSGVTPTALSYGTTYEVHLVSGSSNLGNSIYFKAPADNSTSHDVDLTADKTHSYTEKGSNYTQVFSDVTFENQKWYRFTVTCGDDTARYAIYVKTS